MALRYSLHLTVKSVICAFKYLSSTLWHARKSAVLEMVNKTAFFFFTVFVLGGMHKNNKPKEEKITSLRSISQYVKEKTITYNLALDNGGFKSRTNSLKKNSHETSPETECQLLITGATCIAEFHASELQLSPL